MAPRLTSLAVTPVPGEEAAPGLGLGAVKGGLTLPRAAPAPGAAGGRRLPTPHLSCGRGVGISLRRGARGRQGARSKIWKQQAGGGSQQGAPPRGPAQAVPRNLGAKDRCRERGVPPHSRRGWDRRGRTGRAGGGRGAQQRSPGPVASQRTRYGLSCHPAGGERRRARAATSGAARRARGREASTWPCN